MKVCRLHRSVDFTGTSIPVTSADELMRLEDLDIIACQTTSHASGWFHILQSIQYNFELVSTLRFSDLSEGLDIFLKTGLAHLSSASIVYCGSSLRNIKYTLRYAACFRFLWISFIWSDRFPGKLRVTECISLRKQLYTISLHEKRYET